MIFFLHPGTGNISLFRSIVYMFLLSLNNAENTVLEPRRKKSKNHENNP